MRRGNERSPGGRFELLRLAGAGGMGRVYEARDQFTGGRVALKSGNNLGLAVPDEWVDGKALVGPPARIKQRYRAWEESGATTITVRSADPKAIDVMADAARLNRA